MYVIVWYRNKPGNTKKLEQFLHQATRIALGTAYRPFQPGYVYYAQRIRILKILTLSQRREISMIISTIKILKANETKNLQSILSQHLRGTHNTRSNRLFNVPVSSPLNATPLQAAMQLVNSRCRHININESIATIKHKLKMAMMNNPEI